MLIRGKGTLRRAGKVVPQNVIVEKVNINVECRIKNADRRKRPGHIAFKLIESFSVGAILFSAIFTTAPVFIRPVVLSMVMIAITLLGLAIL